MNIYAAFIISSIATAFSAGVIFSIPEIAFSVVVRMRSGSCSRWCI